MAQKVPSDIADKYHARAEQIANKYIKDNWGSMAFENLPFDSGLYSHWLACYDEAIDNLYKGEC